MYDTRFDFVEEFRAKTQEIFLIFHLEKKEI